MKIGEFAKACNVPVSVLRYYDSCGLLQPVYVDRFTGYRYYSDAQIAVFKKIRQLQAAGFCVSEIKEILFGNVSDDKIEKFFNEKKSLLLESLSGLEKLHDDLMKGAFMTTKKMSMPHEPVKEIPFENDPLVVGKWKILGEFEDINDFELSRNKTYPMIGDKEKNLYFLPNGEWYWCYSWTKGKLLFENGDCSFACDYSLEKREDGRYMFVQYKSYRYFVSGKMTLIVLCQIDHRAYTSEAIARKDDIDMPFMDDPTVIGKWISVAWVKNKAEFSSANIRPNSELYFRSITFLPEGECESVYGKEVLSGRNVQEWTKGFWLRKWNSNACAYEIITIDGSEYMFLEWKSGDYRWGGFDTDYYVLTRE